MRRPPPVGQASWWSACFVDHGQKTQNLRPASARRRKTTLRRSNFATHEGSRRFRSAGGLRRVCEDRLHGRKSGGPPQRGRCRDGREPGLPGCHCLVGGGVPERRPQRRLGGGVEPAIRLAPVLGDALGQAPITMSRYSKRVLSPASAASRSAAVSSVRRESIHLGALPHGTGLGARLGWT